MLVAPETAFGIETWRWENEEGRSHPQNSSIRGMRPNGYRPYPAMMYKALQKNPWKFESQIAASEVEQRNLESRGFVGGGQGAAAEAFDAQQLEIAKIAAARNYEDRNMGERAKAESNAVEQASSAHVAAIPEKKFRKTE
jgi:hypothetical protein